jgi:4-hydroxythreonine-4-phosphate dehydrogenase
VEKVITIVHQDMRDKFGITSPRLLVCGLNPHAGEQGYLGNEEQLYIEPVISRLINEGLDITGPVSADTAFTPVSLDNFDVIICMYHDQGLPVLKSSGFGNIVNVTLGLPIIRTSVDHGTAFDLVGTGKADSSSLGAALNCAVELVNQSNLNSGI